MIIDRIMQIIDFKGINKRKFYIETGLSNGFLDKVKDIGVSKIELILNTYPDINPIWLLTGIGHMTIKTAFFENIEGVDPTYIDDPLTYYHKKNEVKEWTKENKSTTLKNEEPDLNIRLKILEKENIALREQNNYLKSNTTPSVSDSEKAYKELSESRLDVIKGLKFQIAVLEEKISELRYTRSETFLHANVAEPAPELTGKKRK